MFRSKKIVTAIVTAALAVAMTIPAFATTCGPVAPAPAPAPVVAPVVVAEPDPAVLAQEQAQAVQNYYMMLAALGYGEAYGILDSAVASQGGETISVYTMLNAIWNSDSFNFADNNMGINWIDMITGGYENYGIAYLDENGNVTLMPMMVDEQGLMALLFYSSFGSYAVYGY